MINPQQADTPAVLAYEQRARRGDLSALPDQTNDTSDILKLSDEASNAGARGRFHRPLNQQITDRVDADVPAWLKSRGKGYQGRVNAILKREMLASLDQARRM